MNFDDGDACTTDSCDPVAGALHAVNWQPDKNPCTADVCDKATGQVTRPIQSDCWYTLAPAAQSPKARTAHSAVWLGDRMIIWGGTTPGGQALFDGGLYDPTTNKWTAIAKAFAEFGSIYDGFSFASKGRLAVAGGRRESANGSFGDHSGSVFNPTTFAWTGFSGLAGVGGTAAETAHGLFQTHPQLTSAALYPDVDNPAGAQIIPGAWGGWERMTAVGIGDEVLLYGGWVSQPTPAKGGRRYNFITKTWADLKPENPPGLPYRWDYMAAWTGSRYLIWGGGRNETKDENVNDNTGSLYDPATDAWAEMTMDGAPSPRAKAKSIWLGSRWFIWGGQPGGPGGLVWDGALYDPVADAWKPATKQGAPPPLKAGYSVVWNGEALIFWGTEKPSDPNEAGQVAFYYP